MKDCYVRFVLFFLLLSASTAFMSICAQTAPDSTLDSIRRSRVVQLQEVQVVGYRANARTPMSFNTIHKDGIQRTNFGQDIPYLLSLTPGLVSTSDAGTGLGYTSLSIRGADASRINIMTNGVPLNDSESQGVFWVNMPDFASSLQDVQVQRGVGTSSNGAAAFGASINMRTDHPALQPYAQVDLSGGSYGAFRRTFKIGSGRINGRWAVDARISRITSDGYIDRSGVDLSSYFVQGAYFGESTLLKLISFGGKEKTGIAWNGIDPKDIAKKGRTYNSAGYMYTDADGKDHFYRNTDNYTQRHYQALLTQLIGEHLTLNATLHLTRGLGYTDEYRIGRKLLEYNLEPYTDGEGKKVKKTDLLRQKELDNYFYGLVSSLTYRQHNLEVSVGLSLNQYDGKHFGEIKWIKQYKKPLSPDYRYYDNNSRKSEFSAFARASYSPIQGLNLFADLQCRGFRYRLDGVTDKYDTRTKQMLLLNYEQSSTFFNPKAGISYAFSPLHTLYASMAMSHREPNRKAYTEASSAQYPQSERLIDYELGYRFTLEQLQASANAYYMDYEDQLVFDGRQSDVGEMLLSNVPKSYRMGLEFAMAWRPASFFRWDIALALSRNKIKQYDQTAEVYGPTDQDYALHTETLKDRTISFSPSVVVTNVLTGYYCGFELSLTSRYVGKQYFDNTQSSERSMPAYFVSDLRLSYQVPIRYLQRMSIGLAVNNLFNTDYYSNGGAGFVLLKDKTGQLTESSWKWIYPQAPTNVMAMLSIAI